MYPSRCKGELKSSQCGKEMRFEHCNFYIFAQSSSAAFKFWGLMNVRDMDVSISISSTNKIAKRVPKARKSRRAHVFDQHDHHETGNSVRQVIV